MCKQEQVLEGLGFKSERKTNEYERWRHNLSDKHDKEFALIIYSDYPISTILMEAEKMLRKIGQRQKIDQMKAFID
jgi:hypothetical protein